MPNRHRATEGVGWEELRLGGTSDNKDIDAIAEVLNGIDPDAEAEIGRLVLMAEQHPELTDAITDHLEKSLPDEPMPAEDI